MTHTRIFCTMLNSLLPLLIVRPLPVYMQRVYDVPGEYKAGYWQSRDEVSRVALMVFFWLQNRFLSK
jgi:hypothetical protein